MEIGPELANVLKMAIGAPCAVLFFWCVFRGL